MTFFPLSAHMSSGEMCILLVYRFWKFFHFNVSTCKTFWTCLVSWKCGVSGLWLLLQQPCVLMSNEKTEDGLEKCGFCIAGFQTPALQIR